jgi:4-hydroxythreonine-4-phosphate dehydrogenase
VIAGGGAVRPRLAITLGDPRGIGPEVAAAAARAWHAGRDNTSLLFIGPRGTGAEVDADAFEAIGSWQPGGSAAEAGRLAALAVEHGARLALSGVVDALVTAPLDKAALRAAGWSEPGHTELLARLAGVPDPVMLMSAERTSIGGPLRVALATTHIALRNVPRELTADRLVRQTVVTYEALRDDWDIAVPRLALCAFNPHASDGGLFGDEEERIYGPAFEALERSGISARGPLPADTVFVRALRGEFDAVIAPYHDVGMAAFKTASFGSGVNVTLGLPFVRTSPDHGTALDIAGQGVADHGSMLEAMRLATRLAAHRYAAHRKS